MVYLTMIDEGTVKEMVHVQMTRLLERLDKTLPLEGEVKKHDDKVILCGRLLIE